MSSGSSKTPPLKTEAQAAQWLLSLVDYERRPPGGGDPTRVFHLERFAQLLGQMGDPQKEFASVHVAGTSGKGWICSALAAICTAAGLKTGLYLSPHLRSFTERIRIDNVPISGRQFARGISELRELFSPGDSGAFRTVFEILTALAFQTFARERVDIAIIETGLGGRLDCTNVVQPRLSIIATIGWDHMAILGNTISAITREKAGIIKPRTPVVVSEQNADMRAEVMAELRRAAAGKKAPLIEAQRRVKIATMRESFAGSLHEATFSNHTLPIRWGRFGPAAETNLKTILAAVEQLRRQGLDLPDRAIQKGLAQWQWPGRLEVVARRPTIVIDGGHNTSSARSVRQALDRVAPGKRIHWIVGMLKDKDIAGVLRELVRQNDVVIATDAPPPRGGSARDVAIAALEFCPRVDSRPSLKEALALAKQQCAPSDVIAIVGSLYIVAAAEDLSGG